MKRHALICGLVGGVLIALLKWTEYRFLVIEHSVEIYGGLIAAVFSGLGLWLGVRLMGTRRAAEETIAGTGGAPAEARVSGGLIADEKRRDALGITKRELEILELVALGLTNREIAEKLFVSENTVKTHCSHAFDKLGAKRRTQAVQLGKQSGLLR